MEEDSSKKGTMECTTGMSTAHHEKTVKRIYKQIYRKDWENNPLFQGWLSPVPCDKYKAECTACKKELLAHRLTLLKHASSAKHLKRVAMVASKSQSSDATIENSKIPEMNGTAANNVENTIDILPQQMNMNKMSAVQFTNNATIKINHESSNNFSRAFGEEMEARLPHLSSGNVATNTLTMKSTMPNDEMIDTSEEMPVLENVTKIIIQSDPPISMPDISEAIHIKDGYVAKTQTPQTILCAATFMDAKINETGSTVHPLQISTRVTDYSRGISAVNLAITLYNLTGGKWVSVGQSITDNVGRCNLFHKNDIFFPVGLYKLHYDVATYYDQENLKSYFPFIEIVFQMKSLHETHHIPLMISPNGYTAYKSMDY